jgi:outer membrane lipoprotein-sorting protein
MKINRLAVLGITLAALGTAGLAVGRTKEAETPEAQAALARLNAILEKFDQTQAETKTLTASFVERKELGLLREPLISKGRFYYTKPDDILWQYTDPDPRYFLISKDELLTYAPLKKRAEKVSIVFYHDRLLKVLAIGQPSKNLRKYYNLRLEENDNPLPKTNLLILEPRKRTVKKRIQVVKLWVSADRGLPVQMQYCEPDGDMTTISFEDLRFNPEIANSTYKIEIPKGVEIHHGFSGFANHGEKDQG